jgi:asparagine synthase (glutamine-hydrolysing)
MNAAQAHRGPDGEGIYLSCSPTRIFPGSDEIPADPSLCALGHRRLAVIDPEGGAQPMVNDSRETAVLLNGEIYNFQEIREELRREGRAFRTDTDTEILLHLYDRSPEAPARWLRELNGIFAIALWDNRRRRLLLARDHFGVKPLHYRSDGSSFVFASEVKAILAAGVRPKLDAASLHLFMNVRYVPGEATLFEGIRRLPPGHFAWVEEGRLSALEPFYSLPAGDGTAAHDRRAVQEEVKDVFYRAVDRQLLSDVPVGMALSGGLDSSMIVAAAAESYRSNAGLRTADRILRTFSLGFNEPTDENEDAAVVAKHFATEHHDMRLPASPLEGLREVIRAVEEPKVNVLQGYALARFVRSKVKVVLGGLGGDELFAGYDIHRYCNTLGALHRAVPLFLQRALFGPLGGLLWHLQHRSGALRTELYRIGAQIALSAGDRAQFYCRLRNAWDFDGAMYDRIYARPDDFRQLPSTGDLFRPSFQGGGSFLGQVLRTEFRTKMVDDFLVNEDRVTSAHGLEARVPFLDRDLVELAFRIPPAWKMSGPETKHFWKESVGAVLPRRILAKKKQGFTFSSYHQWLKDLRGVIERDLTREWCGDSGLFNYRFVEEILEYPPHPNLRWHYFMLWMMVGVKEWTEVFGVEL